MQIKSQKRTNEIKTNKSKQDTWHGAIYIRKLADYKNMGVSLAQSCEIQGTETIGFFGRAEERIHIDKVRREPNDFFEVLGVGNDEASHCYLYRRRGNTSPPYSSHLFARNSILYR